LSKEKFIFCVNCKIENFYLLHKCISCGSLLREKIPHINFWESFFISLYDPIAYFEKAFVSEKKNFVLLSFLFLATKIFIITQPFANLLYDKYDLYRFISFDNFQVLSFVLIFLYLYALIIANSFLTQRKVLDQTKVIFPLKNFIALNLYVFLPNVVIFPALFFLQLSIFGEGLIKYDPFLYYLKPFAFYSLIFLEAIFFLWTATLKFFSNALFANKSFNLLLFSFLFIAIIYLPLFLYSLVLI